LKYAQTPEDLQTDPQAVIYAVAAMEKTGADSVLCRWVYYRRDPKKPKAKKVEASLSHLDKLWEGVLSDISEMRRLRDSGAKAKQVPFNVAGCGAFGGCGYSDLCKLSIGDKLKGYAMAINLKERILNKTPATPAAPAPAQASVNPPEGMSALARLKARQAAPNAPAQAEAAKAAAPALAAVAGTTEDHVIVAAPAKPTMLERMKAKQTPAVAATPESEAKPKKAKATKTRADVIEAQVAEPGADFAKPIGVLYIGCRPDGACTEFSEIGATVNATIKAEHGQTYRMIPNTFGAAPAMFSQAVGEFLDLNPQASIVVDPASEMSRDALDALIVRAEKIVRGF
jgi:pyruvate/2-oxoglutarate dehydrogenase complex dihydrolipoamide acyltransferase (E2) component